jgi:hypothetical protein
MLQMCRLEQVGRVMAERARVTELGKPTKDGAGCHLTAAAYDWPVHFMMPPLYSGSKQGFNVSCKAEQILHSLV